MERFELIEGFNGWDLHPDDTGDYVLFDDAMAEIQTLRKQVAELEADKNILEQALTDPENQPSQFGTVPIEWYENLENKLERVRFKLGEIIDGLDGNYEKHAIRKALQEAIE